jgi:hypothetical protein
VRRDLVELPFPVTRQAVDALLAATWRRVIPTGSSLSDFQASFGWLPPSMRQVPVFTVLFGEGGGDELTQVATQTGGKVFDARKVQLSEVFQEIRGYQ